MGEEARYHVHDSCSRSGHTYLEPFRAVVLYSRAKVGFVLIGSTAALISQDDKFSDEHPCKEVVRHMIQALRYVDLSLG